MIFPGGGGILQVKVPWVTFSFNENPPKSPSCDGEIEGEPIDSSQGAILWS